MNLAIENGSPRRGLVLVMVLIVIAMLSLAGFTFAELMFTENKASRLHGRELQAQALVDSGVELVQVLLEQPASEQAELAGVYDNADLLSGSVVLASDPATGATGRFSVITYEASNDRATGRVRYGVTSESARLNLAVLLDWEQQHPGAARNALLQLPGMSEESADAILDWIDPYDETRELGAERDHYADLEPPYTPSNRVPGVLEELLLVRDVTPELLFGQDRDRNGRIDPGEESTSSAQTTSPTLEPGSPLGWASFLTLHSAEGNLNAQRQPRIFVNDTDLARLYQRLTNALDEKWATFIVAYRLHGPSPAQPQMARAREVHLDLSQPPSFAIGSLLDLIGANVAVASSQLASQVLIESPLQDEQSSLRTELPKLYDLLTLRNEPRLVGRIDLNRAPREVLLAVPTLDETLVEEILAKRKSLFDPYRPDAMRHATWLLTEDVVTLEQMRQLDPFLTGAGDVHRCQVVGYFDESGPSDRAEVVIDATLARSRVVSWKNLRPLGRGYALGELGLASPDDPAY